MPELPEVETIRIGLSALLPGKRITGVWHDWAGSKPGEYVYYCAGPESGGVVDFARQRNEATPSRKHQQSAKIDNRLATENIPPTYPRSFPNAQSDVEAFLIGAHVAEVRRRAKVLLIELDTKYSLVIHLKMTGQLVYIRKRELSVASDQSSATTEDRRPATDNTTSEEVERFGAGHPNDSLIGELPDKSTRVIFDLEETVLRSAHRRSRFPNEARNSAAVRRSQLFFNDQRKFGWVRLLPTAEVPNIDFFKSVGPEPLAADFTAKDFVERLMKRPRSNIKAVLLDQTVIAGVGNIYADEALFVARIHPSALVKDLSNAQMKKLYKTIREVLTLSIEKGGSTDRNYVDAEGKKGSYLSFAKVFRKEGQPCPRCEATIIKTRVAGRGTHICPRCQKP